MASPGAELFGGMVVGHSPAEQLRPQDETLFKAFQSNLLSLISHELRTPLMGILNSLSMMDAGDEGELAQGAGISGEELVKMARKNANQLHHSLAALLDLAQLESGVFHARLREVDLSKAVRSRIQVLSHQYKDAHWNLKIEDFSQDSTSAEGGVILADPQKLGRAIELTIHAILPRLKPESQVLIRVEGTELRLEFQIKDELKELWEQNWTQAQVGFEGGVGSPHSAFFGVLQSQQAFLSRQEEGLGTELLLIHEIMRLHRGRFSKRDDGRGKVSLILGFARVESEEDLRAILSSRAYDVSTELASVALVLIKYPESVSSQSFSEVVKKSLFRAKDAVYLIPNRSEVALVLDDCKAEDVPGLVDRLKRKISEKVPAKIQMGWAQCPTDGLDPRRLLEIAESRI